MLDAWLLNSARPTRVMGILNATPDSFSDGGRFDTVDAATKHADAMIAEGADLIDVGGESTRPGSLPVEVAEQIRRVVPVIQAIRAAHPEIAISTDTTRAEVAAAALDAGAAVVNDISAGRDDPGMIPLVARRGVPIILMHMQGTPATMQIAPTYADVTAQVCRFLSERVDACVAAGVARHRVMIDPGIGFGKTLEHNLTLLRDLPRIVALGPPVLVGTSRKGFIGKVTGETDAHDRRFGTAATVAWSVANGAALVRVHDVGPMVQVVRMTRAMMGKGD